MFYVYILKLKNQDLYIGFSKYLKQRVKEYFRGIVKTTKNKNPQLIFYCAFKNKQKALKFERYLKSSSGFAFRNKHLI
jgi:putative endonuclease